METLTLIDCLANFAMSFMACFIVRQTLHGKGKMVWLFRVPLLTIAFVTFLKGWQRIEGDQANALDLTRDCGWLGLLITVVIFHWKRFQKL